MGSFHLPSRKLRLRLIGAAVAVAVVVLGVTTIKALQPGGHLTECGVDAKGPYAKIRVNSLRARLGMGHVGLTVDFTYDGYWYDGRVNGSSTTTFVRGTWPPSVINPGWDGGPNGRIIVPGRVAGGHWVNTGKGLQKTYPKLRPKFKALVEPDDKSLLGCKVFAPYDD
jgi:hypothetical protein